MSHRFLDVFETYVCLDCGANWERAVFIEDKHSTRYRWKMTGIPIKPVSLMVLNIGCADLDHALASWTRPPFEEQPSA